MIYAIALCLYVLCYLVIQVMFLFYGCHVSQHKRKVFVILVVYTILFKGMDFLLNSPDPSALSTTTYWTYWAVHTLDTFILIFLMAVYADGTLGRNWVKLFFYYDLVTIGANMLDPNNLALFLSKHHLVHSKTLFSQPAGRSFVDPSLGIQCGSHRTIHSIVSQTFEPASQQDPGKPLPAPHGDHFPDLHRQGHRHVHLSRAAFSVR